MGVTFVLKKAETFPLAVEIDHPSGKGTLTVDCKLLKRTELVEILAENSIDKLFDTVVTAVHGIKSEDGEMTGKAAIEFFRDGELAPYLMPAFKDAYFEQFGEARRKNGQPLRAR